MVGIIQGMHVIHDLVGQGGSRVFEKQEFLTKVKGISEDVAKTIEEAVSDVTNPIFELSRKAAATYNIAYLRIKSGDKVIGSGATTVSFSDFTRPPEIKSRMSLPNGVQIKGSSEKDVYVDVKTDKNGKDIVTEYSLKDGKVLYTNQFDTNVTKSEITQINGYGVDNGLIEYNKDNQVISERWLDCDSASVERFFLNKRLNDNSVIDISCYGESFTLTQKNRLDKKEFEISGYGNNDSDFKFSIRIKDESDGNNIIIFNNKNEVESTIPKSLAFYNNLYGKPVEEFIEKYNLGELWAAYQSIPQEVLKAEKLLPAMKAKHPNWKSIVPETIVPAK